VSPVCARTRLLIKEEWVFHLEGLRVPKWPEPERARGFGSTQLFLERAQAANPHFAMGEAETPSVSRICQLLDGAPLTTVQSTPITVTAGGTANVTISYTPTVNGVYSFKFYPMANETDQQANNDTIVDARNKMTM
jgi:hypothetical protein